MKQLLFVLIINLLYNPVSAQNEKKQIREGNSLYNKQKYRDSEVAYQKALKADPNSFKAVFNLGDALYKQEKYEEAARQFSVISEKPGNKENSARVYHNLGNSYLLGNKIDESIDTYKKALRNNPKDMTTKYNLAYAQMLKKKQEQQQNQDNKQQQQQQQQQKQQEKQEQQPENKEQEVNKEDAERMLQALQDEEKETQDKVKKAQMQNVKQNIDKDW